MLVTYHCWEYLGRFTLESLYYVSLYEQIQFKNNSFSVLASRAVATAILLLSVEVFISYSGSQNLRIKNELIDFYVSSSESIVQVLENCYVLKWRTNLSDCYGPSRFLCHS